MGRRFCDSGRKAPMGGLPIAGRGEWFGSTLRVPGAGEGVRDHAAVLWVCGFIIDAVGLGLSPMVLLQGGLGQPPAARAGPGGSAGPGAAAQLVHEGLHLNEAPREPPQLLLEGAEVLVEFIQGPRQGADPVPAAG